MSERLKVDVVGPAGRRWLALPAAAPVADLLPALVPLLGGDEPVEWALAPPVGAVLDPDTCLRDSGIRPGSTLCLVAAQLAADADGTVPPRELVGMRTPLERTAAALPAPLGGWQRVRTALWLAHGRVPAAAPPPGHPSAFMQARPPRAWRRAWRAWRDLDHVARLEAVVTAPRLRRAVTIAVVSPPAGPGSGGGAGVGDRVGKTVVASLLGTVLARLRSDRVIALDTAPGAGSLVALAAPGLARYLDRLLRGPVEPGRTLARLDASLVQGYHGLRVRCAPPDPELRARLDEDAYRETMDRLTKFAGLLIVDCPGGLDGPAARAAVEAADQVVLVTDIEGRPTLAEAVSAVRGEARSVLVVANAPRSRAGARDAGRLAVTAAEADGLVRMPWSPAGVAQLTSGRFDWAHAPAAWRLAAHELAAAAATEWRRLDLSL